VGATGPTGPTGSPATFTIVTADGNTVSNPLTTGQASMATAQCAGSSVAVSCGYELMGTGITNLDVVVQSLVLGGNQCRATAVNTAIVGGGTFFVRVQAQCSP
jgi:hypothetical protein